MLDRERVKAFDELAKYYADVYGDGRYRNEYAIPAGALTDPNKQHQMAAFFWWTAWAASTNRPGEGVTYTQNWPHEELIGNRPTGAAVVWSVISFVLLLAGVGGMVWYFGSQQHAPSSGIMPHSDPLLGLKPTASHKRCEILFRRRCALGGTGCPWGNRRALRCRRGEILRNSLAKWLPHTVARTEPFDDLVAGARRAQFAQKPVNLSESASQVPPDR